MKQKFRYAVLLLAVVLLLSVTVFADTDIVKPTEQLYVADYANILSPETENMIVNQVTQLKAACGGEIAVVTIDFLNDLDSEEYAYEVLNRWGVGDKKKNNGIVVLLVPGEGKGWITIGTGLEDYISAGTLDSILNDWMWDDFDAGNYDRAVTNTFVRLVDQYESYYGITVDGSSTPSSYYDDSEYVYYGNGYQSYSPIRSIFRGLRQILFWTILFYLLLGNGRRRGGGSFLPWLWFSRHHHHHHHHHHRPPHDPWNHGPRGPRGPGGFGGGGFGGGFGGGRGGGGFGGGSGRGGGAGRR